MKFNFYNIVCIGAAAVQALRGSLPTVTLDNDDTIIGIIEKGVESFRGIPFAEPPIGDLRFKHPVPFQGSVDGLEAFDFGPCCVPVSPFKFFDTLGALGSKVPGFLSPSALDALKMGISSEDCLTINVWRPEGTKPGDNLPVMVWIHGGAFLFGAPPFFPGDPYVQKSMKMDQPVVFVSVAYRFGPWGFLGGNAILEEGSANAGLMDQRLGLEWIADNIHSFGGNPCKVTIMGNSAGAMSIGYHMISNDGDISYKGKDLFHAAIFVSGDVQTAGDVDSDKPQEMFRLVGSLAGCDESASDEETLECIRGVSGEDLKQAIDHYAENITTLFNAVDLFAGFVPRPDGTFIREYPLDAIRNGNTAQMPMIHGNQEDEGSFIAPALNSYAETRETLNHEFRNYFKYADESLVNDFLELYPSDPEEGCPFRTGNRNAVYPEFKRSAAIFTDALFTVSRRLRLAYASDEFQKYVYFADPLHNIVPILGTFHANDIVWAFFGRGTPTKAYQNYFISFANHHDPNVDSGLMEWPEFTEEDRRTLHIGLTRLDEGVDVFPQENREDAIELAQSSNLLMF